MRSLPLILTLDQHGVPHRWVTWQQAVWYYAKERVAWEVGSEAFTVYGGRSHRTGERSRITANSIIAIRGKALAIRGFNQVPPLNNRELFNRDRFICAFCADNFPPLRLTCDHILPMSRGGGTSEAQLGKALARHPRSAFVLQTKLRPNANPAEFEAQLGDEEITVPRAEAKPNGQAEGDTVDIAPPRPNGIAPAVTPDGRDVAASPVSEPGWPAPLGKAAYHGLAGEVVEAIDPHTEADLGALLVQFLTKFGHVTGRLARRLDRGRSGGRGGRAAPVAATAPSKSLNNEAGPGIFTGVRPHGPGPDRRTKRGLAPFGAV